MGFYDNFFENFDKLFSRIWRDDKNGEFSYRIVPREDGYLVVCNTLGISKEDAKVKLENKKGLPYPVLKVEGETEIEKINFKNKVSFEIPLKIEKKDIESFQFRVENGLTLVFIKLKESQTNKEISAEYSDGSLDF